MKPLKTLRGVRKYLASIDHINYGGCGIAAYSMWLWLKANNQLKASTKFVFCYPDWDNSTYLNNSKVLKSGKGVPEAPSHVILEHQGKYFDCEKEVKLQEYQWVQFVTKEKFVIKTINNEMSWNEMFNRSVIPFIEKRLGIDLSSIRN